MHSAACIDQSLIQREKPDHILLQTNSRFLGVSPNADFSLKLKIKNKLNLLPEKEKLRLISLAMHGTKNDPANKDYWDLMLD